MKPFEPTHVLTLTQQCYTPHAKGQEFLTTRHDFYIRLDPVTGLAPTIDEYENGIAPAFLFANQRWTWRGARPMAGSFSVEEYTP